MLTIILAALAALLGVVAGALLNRFRGGWQTAWLPKSGRRAITLAAYAAPYGLCAAAFSPWWAAGLVAILTAVFASEGHGEQMDLARSPEDGEGRNNFDRIFGKEGFRAEFLALGASGVLIHVPLGIAIAVFANPIVGAAFIAAGFLKAPAYEIGHRFVGALPLGLSHGPDSFGRNPDAGEVLWGAVSLGTAAALVLS